MIKSILPVLTAFLFFTFAQSCESQAQSSKGGGATAAAPASAYQNVDVATFKKLMSGSNVVVLDVRTPGEIAQGKIAGAMELNFNSPDFAQQTAKLDKSKTYLIYCRSGNRSGQACGIMQQQGFGKLYNLQGGMIAWGQQ
ncbi:MAG TPA: rhodanese-like domain-containing protein [Saprospiraceae bacterium]|jgi:rhodanese-related sulfurtransferase|nr:rhodanese-like domain-containing protein [Saprospiraceae bacterium]